MYNLPRHKESNEKVIKEFMEKYPFAFLSGCDADGCPVVTQLPVFIDEKNGTNVLQGHMMKNTDHHLAFMHNQNVLVVFTGHHTYVSGTWYSNPHTPSTWNYMSVHVKGSIRFLDDNKLVEVLRMTTLHFENYNNKSTTIFDNLPADHTKSLMKAIVAFEIDVEEIDTVFKLSQDRDLESYLNIIKQLKEQDESGRVIASEMEKRTHEVFPDFTS